MSLDSLVESDRFIQKKRRPRVVFQFEMSGWLWWSEATPQPAHSGGCACGLTPATRIF
jgi:hypothetical protein